MASSSTIVSSEMAAEITAAVAPVVESKSEEIFET